MNKRSLFGCAVVASVAGSASAAYTGTTVVNMGELIPGSGTTSYRIFVNFDDPGDRLLAISGNAGLSPLRYQGATLVQNAPGLEALDIQDVPLSAAGPGDSWVTIGGNIPLLISDTDFSPGFLNPAFAGASVINGSFFEQLDNGGYFDSDPGTQENGGSVIIAQFTIANGETATFEATVDYALSGEFVATSEVMGMVVIPAPGAIAVLGLAGLAGARRRRG